MSKLPNNKIAELIMNILNTYLFEEKDQTGLYRDAMDKYSSEIRDIIILELSGRIVDSKASLKNLLTIEFSQDDDYEQDLKNCLKEMALPDAVKELIRQFRRSDVVDNNEELPVAVYKIEDVKKVTIKCPSCSHSYSLRLESKEEEDRLKKPRNVRCDSCGKSYQTEIK